jgi:hypothetical protein
MPTMPFMTSMAKTCKEAESVSNWPAIRVTAAVVVEDLEAVAAAVEVTVVETADPEETHQDQEPTIDLLSKTCLQGLRGR